MTVAPADCVAPILLLFFKKSVENELDFENI